MGKHHFKRTTSLLLALVILTALCPAAPAVMAEDTALCPCCGKAISEISWTEYDKWDNSMGSWFGGGVDFSKAGHYRITDSFTMKKEFTVAANVTIDFNGLLLKAKSGSRGFTVEAGGTLTLMNTGGENGRLAGQNTTANGGAVYVEAGGTLHVAGGRVVGTTSTGNGGAVYNAGTVNITGGAVDSGVTTGNGGNIYNTGTLNLSGGVVEAGSVSGDNRYGGNIYSSGALNIYDGAVVDGTAQDHGGNLFLGSGSVTNIYGGTISGGLVTGGDGFLGHGGNIYATGGATTLHIYDGLICDGQNTGEGAYGGNMRLNGGVQAYMYGGAIENGIAPEGSNIQISGNATLADETKQYTALYILGGTITAAEADTLDLYNYSANNKIVMYNCRYNGNQDITGFMADCTCHVTDDTGVTVWNAGYIHGTCADCLFVQAMEAELVTVVSGSHTYLLDGENTYICTVCGHTFQADSIAATVNGNLFESLDAALAAAGEGAVVQLQADATVSELAVSGCTLDLAGFTLRAEAFTSTAGGDVIDTSEKSAGKLIAQSVTLAENNSYLPVTMDDGIHFAEVGFTQWIEPQDVNTTKVKFYFTQRAADTIIDDAVNGGNNEIDVQIRLTWTNSEGVSRDKTYTFGQELMQKYAEKWDSRVFVVTIGGTAGISDLKCTWQVTSTATSGTTLSASTMVDAGYIHENLTWEQINSYPIKRSDMTVEEMRQLCLDFMVFNKNFLWTPDTSVSYIKNKNGSADVMDQGTVYGGLPYVGLATGNPYRMMDYINPDTGLLDMHKALPALGTKDQLTMNDLKYFGNQCSICVYWGWGRVMNSANYRWTSSATPYRDFVILGDVQIPDTVTSWNTTYGTDECVAENGEQVLFGGYAQLQKADGMVYYTTAGHLVMVYSAPVVVYNEDGTINGDESYLTIVDQAQKWEEVTNASGDTYLRKTGVDTKKTFQQLFDSSYIPFTFKEFLGTDPIEVTEVSLVGAEGALASGTVDETTRAFTGTQSGDTLTWSELFGASITSNYGIVDAYIIVTDNYGNEIYRHAVRTATAGNKNLALEEAGEMVTTWETRALTSGKTYKVAIEVQLATGERPTIYNGQLTMDK